MTLVTIIHSAALFTLGFYLSYLGFGLTTKEYWIITALLMIILSTGYLSISTE